MERKTYYRILGVSSTESDEGIRAAYRDLAKKLHPDVAGEQATRSFQEVSEAYRVLSDPQRRREYNHKLNRPEAGEAVPVRRAPEPIVRDPVTILERLEILEFEVLLTPEEASRGCVLPVGVPVLHRCPQCGGSGRDWVFPCVHCRRHGMIEREEQLRIWIPPKAPSGSILEIPLWGLGMHSSRLRLHVFVAGQRR